jgi:hypothetical protein
MVPRGRPFEAAYSLAAATSVRTPVEDLGVSYGIAVAGRIDLSAVSFELRLGLGRAQQDAAHLSSTTRESLVSVAALRFHDFGSAGHRRLPTVGIGLEAGASYLTQRLDSGEQRDTVSPFVGPTAVAEWMTGRRFFLRADLGVPVYMLRTADLTGATATEWRPAVSVALGGGAWF